LKGEEAPRFEPFEPRKPLLKLSFIELLHILDCPSSFLPF